MLKEELSGAVSILRQTTSAGTELPAEPCWPYSARQSRTFMVIQNRARTRRTIREIMWGALGNRVSSYCQSRLRRRNGKCLTDLHPAGVEPGVCGHEGVDFDAVFSRNGGGSFPCPDDVRFHSC